MPSVISINNVSKLYRLGQVGSGTLKDDLTRMWCKLRGKPDPFAEVGQLNKREETQSDGYVWALRDINLEVEAGEILGIIGRNGAGKSTLLKLLSRVTAPTEGEIRMQGRIASLLEVGTGFHPDLTGRENIDLNGTIMGMTRREIADRLDEIVEFSGCAKYIDTPVKRYSSGMKVRLGFAVAAHLECEILIVDEVLAVGDAEFQKKCLGKMAQVAGTGRTVLFVSHNMSSIRRLTQRVVWMEDGQIHSVGDADKTVDEYTSYKIENRACIEIDPVSDREMSLRRVQIGDPPRTRFEYSQSIPILIDYDLNQDLTGVHVACLVYGLGICLFTTGDADLDVSQLEHRPAGSYRGRFEIPSHILNEGVYTITISLGIPMVRAIDRHSELLSFEVIDHTSDRRTHIHRKSPGVFSLCIPWETCVLNSNNPL